AADQRQAAAELVRLAAPEADGRIRPEHPFALGLVDVDRAAERVGPLDHGAVVVRMRDRDHRDPAFVPDAVDELVIEVRDAVPQDVARAALDEQRALTDGERRRAADPEDPAVVADFGLVALEEVFPRDPDLAGVVWDVLTLVLADRARGGRLVGRRVLRRARLAQVARHPAVRSRSATHSTCGVCGNMSTGRARV